MNTLEKSLKYPGNTPSIIKIALENANKSIMCSFVSNLVKIQNNYYSIDAEIYPSKIPISAKNDQRYLVKFNFPASFPYKPVDIIPLDPPLRWYPHQFGDWDILGAQENIICSLQFHTFDQNDLLIPYIDYAHRWISDAIKNELTKPTDNYEFPHIPQLNPTDVIFAEGGDSILPILRKHKFGVASLAEVENKNKYKFFHLIKIYNKDSVKIFKSTLRNDAFGKISRVMSAPWVFFGNPVIELPHKPPQNWADIPEDVQKNIINSLYHASKKRQILPYVMLAFEIPVRWSDKPTLIRWRPIEIVGWNDKIFKNIEGGFHDKTSLYRPKIVALIKKNQILRWVGSFDVSKESLWSRKGKSDLIVEKMNIAVFGIGALGSILVKALSKMNPKMFLLVDKECVEPGNLVRHEALSKQIGITKASAMANLIFPIIEDHKVKVYYGDIINDWIKLEKELKNIDLIIDATGEKAIHAKLCASNVLKSKMITWCYVKPGPEFALLVCRKPESLMQEGDAEFVLEKELDISVWNEFNNQIDGNEGIVWPEPGCQYPTFVAPYHRLRMMSDGILSTILSWIESGASKDVVTLYRQPKKDTILGQELLIEKQIVL